MGDSEIAVDQLRPKGSTAVLDREPLPSVGDELIALEQKVRESTLPSIELFPQVIREARDAASISFEEQIAVAGSKMREGRSYGQLIHSFNLRGELAPAPFSDNSRSTIFGVSSPIPKERALDILNRNRRVLSIMKQHPNYLSLLQRDLEGVKLFINNVLEDGNNALGVVEAIKNGGHFLSHGVSAMNAAKVMESGFLGSRQAQVDRFGKAVITTSSTGGYIIEEYQDKVELITKTGRQSYNRGDDPKIDSVLAMERDEVLFADDYLYTNIGLIYFVFPAGNLLSTSQFYNHDGIHLFPGDYEATKKGYEVSLQERPHILVAREVDRARILELIDHAPWIEDKNKYIQEYVLFTEKEDYYRDSTEVLAQVNKKVEERFAFRQQPLGGSHIIPTGVVLDANQTRFKPDQTPLYSFK